MSNITIKTNSPNMILGLTEGAATVELRAVKAENKKLHAKEGVRAIADEKRWQKTRRKLAKKYSTRPVGRLRGAILGVWGLLWLEVAEWRQYFERINRG